MDALWEGFALENVDLSEHEIYFWKSRTGAGLDLVVGKEAKIIDM